MEVGREFLEQFLGKLERIAVANEELITLATEERVEEAKLTTPGYCPHCGTANPSIRSEGGTGAMNDYVLIALCDNCNKTFYAIPEGWLCVKTPENVRQAMEAANGTS